MQVAMKRNVIRRRLIEPKSHADNNPDPRDGGVQSVDRALLIIETLAEDDEGYRLSDLSVRTGLSTSMNPSGTSARRASPWGRPSRVAATSWRRPCRICASCATSPGKRQILR